MTLDEIAEERGVSRSAVLQAIRNGSLRAFKGRNRWLVRREDAVEYIERPVKGR